MLARLEFATPECMKYSLMILLFSVTAHAGEWLRVSSDTISFTGEISRDDVDSFRKIYRPTDTKILLNSSGGLIEPALMIAQTLIKNKKLETVVHGLCASSCANYLFLAGKTRKIDQGVVGYHGNLRAYLESEKFRNDLSKIDPKIAAVHLPKLRQSEKEEDAFFAEAEVPQDLFTRTQNENDAGVYDIYVPGPNAFLKYGIHNVVGTQDVNQMRSLTNLDKIHILYDDSSDVGTSDPASRTAR